VISSGSRHILYIHISTLIQDNHGRLLYYNWLPIKQQQTSRQKYRYYEQESFDKDIGSSIEHGLSAE